MKAKVFLSDSCLDTWFNIASLGNGFCIPYWKALNASFIFRSSSVGASPVDDNSSDKKAGVAKKKPLKPNIETEKKQKKTSVSDLQSKMPMVNIDKSKTAMVNVEKTKTSIVGAGDRTGGDLSSRRTSTRNRKPGNYCAPLILHAVVVKSWKFVWVSAACMIDWFYTLKSGGENC